MKRLSAALVTLGSDCPPESPTFTCQTDRGRLDGYAVIPGGPRYSGLRAAAVEIDLRGQKVLIGSIDHLIAMKNALGRTKDELMAMEYRAISDELRAPRDS